MSDGPLLGRREGTSLAGVVGGSGPLATACFLETVVRLTDADQDQDHVDLIALQHATTPDRTAHVLGRCAQDPGPVMADDARRLERWGAELVVVPCNTAHHYLAQIAGAVGVPVVSIVAETVAAAQQRRPGLRTVGVLATEGTIAARVYQDALAGAGLAAVVPGPDLQAVVSDIVYGGVKAGQPVDPGALGHVVEALVVQGAELVVLGCTELSVVALACGLLDDARVVDSLDALARTTIRATGHVVRGRPCPERRR